MKNILPGTGKTTLVKILNHSIRIDMDRIKVASKFVGCSPNNLREALVLVNTLAPVNIWLEEAWKG